MFKEAVIHFHYEPGIIKHEHLTTSEKKQRYRRMLSNLVSNILNNIDWHANFTTTIPFLIGNDYLDSSVHGNSSHISTMPSPLRESPTAAQGNASSIITDILTLALHKNWGDRKLSVTRREKLKKVDDDFILSLDRLSSSNSQLAYTL